MSYSFGIGEDTDYNLTYNVSKMLYMVYPKDGIRTVYGKSGKDSIEIIGKFVSYFHENKKKLEELNPSNGWGSYQGTLDMFYRMLQSANTFPSEIWEGD